MTSGRLSRRRLLGLLGGGVVLGGAVAAVNGAAGADRGTAVPTATRGNARPSGVRRTPASGAPSATPSSPTPTPEPPLPPYEPLPGEYLPNAKRLAAAVVTAVTTHGAGSQPGDVASRAAAVDLVPDGAPPAAALAAPEGLGQLAVTVAPLVHPGAASSGEVVYPQCGGDTPTACSIMTVVRQTQRFTDGRPDAVTVRTMDVRLALKDGRWGLETIASIGGEPVPAPPDLPATALAVLADPRIDLPDTCRWDIHAGRIDQRLLATMLQAADLAPYSVCVLSTGHPPKVFGARFTSNHTPGRAVDVWAVDGQPVVLQQPSEASRAFQVAMAVYDAGAVTELGSPWDFDQPGGGRSFANDVHRDHLHLAFHG